MAEDTDTAGFAARRTRPPPLFGMVARWALAPALGRGEAARTARMADARYESPPALARTPGGRFDLRMASYLLALRDALVASGAPARSADELLADAVYRVMRRLQRPLDALAAALHPKDELARTHFRERLARQLFYRPPDWVITNVDAPGRYAFDVRRCIYADYLRGRGEGPFCEHVPCAEDHRMAEGRDQPLRRTGDAGRRRRPMRLPLCPWPVRRRLDPAESRPGGEQCALSPRGRLQTPHRAKSSSRSQRGSAVSPPLTARS